MYCHTRTFPFNYSLDMSSPCFSGCYTLFSGGHKLSEESVVRAYDLQAESYCRDKCNKAANQETVTKGFRCTFYSFG